MELFKAFIPLITIISLWVIIGLYLGKKIKLHKESMVVDKSRPINCLTVTRGVEPTNYLRKYLVIVDGKKIGDIASGETIHFQLIPGKHTINLKIDWCKSKPFDFELVSGKNTELSCGANYNNWKCLFMYVIKPANWVYVKVA